MTRVVKINQLKAGDRFRLPLSGRTGKLLAVYKSRARVIMDPEQVESGSWVESGKNLPPVWQSKTVTRSETFDISLNTEVERV